MRLLFFFCIWSFLLYGQSNFKSIAFSNSPVSTSRLLPMKQVTGLVKTNKQKTESVRSITALQFAAGSSTGFITPIDYLQLDQFYIWAESSQKSRLNLRAANSSIHAFLTPFKSSMKIESINQEFTFVSREMDDIGMQHIRVIQTYKKIPVYGGDLIIHGSNDEMTRLNGKVYPTPLSVNIIPSLNESQAIAIVVQDLMAMDHYMPVSPRLLEVLKRPLSKAELMIYHDEDQLPDPPQAHLAYSISYVANGLEIWNYIVNAHSGKLMNKFKNTCAFLPHDHPALPGQSSHLLSDHLVKSSYSLSFDFMGKTTSNTNDLFGKMISLNTYEESGTFYLVDVSRTMFKSIGADNEEPTGVIWTFDGKNTSPTTKNFNPGLINGPTNTGWISPTAASAHSNAGLAYEYYLSKHERNSINGLGGNIISLINIVDEKGAQMDNAFWNGEALFYGNGKDAFTSLAKALDVAGHELSHGVVQATANMDYENESGALNESFADIFGRLIDRDDWLIGEEVVKKSVYPTGALRSFIDPHNGGLQFGDPGYQPRTYAERYKEKMDNGGVHINSGIPNWAFYQFVTRINNDLNKAEKVYYRALTRYLTRSSRFIDCRKAVIQSATDLFGGNSAEVAAAKAAYDAVGILDGNSTNVPKDIESNPGEEFIAYTNVNQTALFLADPAGTLVSNPLSPKAPLSRASITDDGSAIVFVGKDKKIHYIIIDWKKNQIIEADILQEEPIWRNAAVSRDGHRIAALKDNKENKVHIYDYTLGVDGEWREFELYNPTFTTGVITGDVNYADAIEFDHTSEWLMYDAENTIKNSAGADLNYWDVSFLRVYDGVRSDWGDGKISKLFGQLPEKTSVGNPTFAKNSPYIIAFDMLIESTNSTTYLLLGGNLETGQVDTIFHNGQLSWPSYSTLDDKVIFNATTPTGIQVVGQVNVNSTKIESTGTAKAIINNAKLGTWFANEVRNLSTAIKADALIPYSIKLSPNPVTKNEVQLSWIQPQTSTTNQFSVYDMVGRLHWSTSNTFHRGAQVLEIPVDRLAPGIYLIRINMEGKTGGLKFVRL